MPRKGQSLTPEHLRALVEGRNTAALTRHILGPGAVVDPLLQELRAIRILLDERLPRWTIEEPTQAIPPPESVVVQPSVVDLSAPPLSAEITDLPASDHDDGQLDTTKDAVDRFSTTEPEMPDLAEELAELNQQIADELPPAPPADEMWARRLDMFVRYRQWLPEWGVQPGQSGCAAPDWLLKNFGILGV